MLQRVLWIAVAGSAGALARYFVSGIGAKYSVGGLPLGTLSVNLIGCFCFGLVWSVAEQKEVLSSEARVILLVGFLGAFTTFSTFGFETLQLWRDAKPGLALANVVIQNLGGVLAAYAGMRTLGTLT